MINNILFFLASYLILSVQDFNPIYYLIGFLTCSLFCSSRFIFKPSNLYSLSVICLCSAWLYSLLVAIFLNNNLLFAFRYSGGFLIIPAYFFLSNISVGMLYKFLKYILLSMFFLSTCSLILLIVTRMGLLSIVDPLRILIGSGSASGFADTRYYSLTLVTAVIPLSILLISAPSSLCCLFPKIIDRPLIVPLLRIFGVLFGFTSQILLFSKSYFIYIIFLVTIILLTSSSSFLRLKTRKLTIVTIVTCSIATYLLFQYIIGQVDPSRLSAMINAFSVESNYQRYDQLEYMFSHFSWSGHGLGASFEGTPLLRSYESPYGIENSLVNLYHKFGFSILFMSPLLIVIFRCLYRLQKISRLLVSKSVTSRYDYQRLSFYMLLFIILPSCSYFILFSVGNPVLFHIQLNYLFILIFSFCSRIEPSYKSYIQGF